MCDDFKGELKDAYAEIERLREEADFNYMAGYDAAESDYRDTLQEREDEIDRLKAEVQTWINHTKTAVWSDSEECKFLTAENEELRSKAAQACDEVNRLRAALTDVLSYVPHGDMPVTIYDNARAALEASEDAADVAIYDARKAALDAENKPANRRKGIKEALSSLIEEDGKLIFETPKDTK